MSTCKQRPLEPLTARQGGSPAILQRAGPLKERRCEGEGKESYESGNLRYSKCGLLGRDIESLRSIGIRNVVVKLFTENK